VVLTGHGRGFCSGGSVEQIIGPLLETELDGTLTFTRMTGAVVRNMLRLGKPIVAAINGVAAGAGAVIALASDIRVMAQSAKFAFLFTKVGLTGADMGAAWLLPKVVGTGRDIGQRHACIVDERAVGEAPDEGA
jgi:enoyl-CoA hydratase/carnithine racemase